MSATSLLMARNELDIEPFDNRVHHPAGFTSAGDPSTYKDTNFCTPYCSPPKADNLWAHIRMNHGVQFSREFLIEIIETVGEAILAPESGELFNGIPNATRTRIAADPDGFVSCFFKIGNGHCVTPYAVAGDTIHIYDNNEPHSIDREILIQNGDYNYPKRTKEPNQGNAIAAFPISIWKEGRHLFGFSELRKLINGDVVEFLVSIAVGDAEMEVVTGNGSLGFLGNGARVDHVPGGMMLPLMGPSEAEMRQIPALLAMNQSAPLVRIHAKGSNYTYHTGARGHFLQLASNSAESGGRDDIQLQYEAQSLTGMSFSTGCRCQQCGAPSRTGHR